MTSNTGSGWLRLSSLIAGLQHRGIPAGTEELAASFADGLSAILDTASCSVFLADDRGTGSLAGRSSGEPLTNKDYSADMPLMKYLAASGKSIFTAGSDERCSERNLFPGGPAESRIISPVFVDDRLRGFLHASSPRRQAFSREDLALAEHAAGVISLIMTVSSLSAAVEQLTVRDPLTGCLNRKKFIEDIEIDIPCAERYGKPLSLLKIAIDCMKGPDQTYGLSRCGEVLGKIGETLAYSIRKCDRLYRSGEEEFIITLPGIDRERALFAANRLLKVLGQISFEGAGEDRPALMITCSVGVASFPSDAVYRDGLIRVLDAALRKAKEEGGDKVLSLRL